MPAADGYFFGWRLIAGEGFGLSIWNQIRGARLVAVGALTISVFVPSAGARLTPSSDGTESKTASTKTTTHKRKASAGASKSASKTRTASAGKRSSRKKRPRGQQKIDSERAQAIQEALIREHYLAGGEATGTWNQASEEAMRRYQADQGWQSKTVPDSRALIKLGLGPSKDHLLNPESAMTTVPDSPRAEPMPTTSHSASPTTGSAPGSASDPNDSSRPQ